MFLFNNDLFLGPNSSYELQVDNINTVEEADAYKEYLVSAMERVQRSKVSLVKTNTFFTSIS